MDDLGRAGGHHTVQPPAQRLGDDSEECLLHANRVYIVLSSGVPNESTRVDLNSEDEAGHNS